MCVLDTPGYPHSSLSKEQVQQEVKAALVQHFGKKGLHLAILVLRADVPFCEEDPTIPLIQELLGPNWGSYTAILFTHADLLENSRLSSEQYLHTATDPLHEVMQSVQQKYIFVNNHASIRKEENIRVLRKIMEFVRQNSYQTLLFK
ncbi:GTPase IMAP family member GIMD1 [Varanus komodoensis]|nr:GTPase IMAP family member GIMD1 [Varanus komodoensis]